MKRRLCRLLAVILLLSVAGALRATEEAEPWTLLRPEVLAEYPHDPAAFTQGLLWHAGLLYESIGLYEQSALRQVELATGEVVQDAETGRLYEISLRHLPVFAKAWRWQRGNSTSSPGASKPPSATTSISSPKMRHLNTPPLPTKGKAGASVMTARRW